MIKVMSDVDVSVKAFNKHAEKIFNLNKSISVDKGLGKLKVLSQYIDLKMIEVEKKHIFNKLIEMSIFKPYFEMKELGKLIQAKN